MIYYEYCDILIFKQKALFKKSLTPVFNKIFVFYFYNMAHTAAECHASSSASTCQCH